MKETETSSDVLKALGFVKADAMSNLEAKRGCTWANRIIVATVEAVERFEAVRDFYYKEERTELDNMFSAFLQRKDGFLDVWQDACVACLKEKTPPNAAEAEAVNFAGGVLWQALFCIFGLSNGAFGVADCMGVSANMRKVAEKDNEANRKGLKESVWFHTFNVAETCYRLSIREWKVWSLHRDWPVDWAEWETNGPFDGRGAVKALCQALESFDAEHPYVFYYLRTAMHGLLNSSELLPRAFMSKTSEKGVSSSFERAVIEIMTTDPQIVVRYPPNLAAVLGVEEQTYVPSNFFKTARRRFLVMLYAHLSANANKSTSDTARRMWLEAAAEFLMRMSLRQSKFAQEDAERIVALANRAQRESWIDRKMARSKKKVEPVEILPTLPEPPEKKTGDINAQEIAENVKAKLIDFAKAYIDGYRGSHGRKGGKKTGKRTGKTLHTGRQTDRTVDQFARLQKYLSIHHVIQSCSYKTLNKWINSFWNENRKEFEKAAKAKGQERGYSSPSKLFRAAKNKGYGQ